VSADRDFSISRQAELLAISRSGYYYKPRIDEEDIRIMGCMDEIFTTSPFYGSRRIQKELAGKPYEIDICRDHVRRLMKEMGLEAIYPKRKMNCSDPALEHKKYPYLLLNLPITFPNQVWGTDITYITLKNTFCYLVAILDWYSRYVVSWTMAETLDIGFCLENVGNALECAIPNIHNSDQGSHFTSSQYTDLLTKAHIRISMDGRGRCMDNIFTERLWRTVKYENVYTHSYGNFQEAQQGISEYFNFYNHKRRHQSLDYQTPATVYFNSNSRKQWKISPIQKFLLRILTYAQGKYLWSIYLPPAQW